jgi:hypothetical protein
MEKEDPQESPTPNAFEELNDRLSKIEDRLQQNTTLDAVAQELYGAPYEKLSPWGQKVAGDLSLKRQGGASLPVGGTLQYESAHLAHENKVLHAKVRDLQIENGELWQENGELRARLHQIADQE